MAVGDLIWFVDDDETATPAALSELLEAMKRFDADGVFGPVLPKFEGNHPSWILTSSAFNRSIHETGRRARAFRTSNTLVRAAVLQKVPGPFDPSYGLSGGADSMLFRQLELLGAKFIDCGEGAVVETVPESRANWPWIRDRVRRQGQNHARQTVSLTGSVANPSVLALLVKATVQIVAMAPIVALGKRHSHRRAEAHMRLWSNIGKVEGVAGVVTTRSL